jgi:hypothetical protein
MGLGACVRVLLLIALACALGCDSELNLRYHGRQLVAEGDYRVLSMFGDGRHEFALAIDHAHDDQMTVLPFGGKPCHLGHVASYFAVRAPVDGGDGLRFALFDSNDEPRTLRFVDAKCKQTLGPIENVVETKLIEREFLVGIDGGRLLVVDPWAARTRVLTENLTALGSSADVPTNRTAPTTRAFWLLEGDRLVLRDYVRDYDRNKIRETEAGVTDIAVTRQGQAMIYSDAKGTYRLGHEGYDRQRIGEPACGLRYETGVRGVQAFDLAMMLAPCEAGRLISIDPDGRRREFADHVVSYFRRLFVVGDAAPEAWTFYVTQDGADAEKRYFMASPDTAAAPIELDVPISSRSTLLPSGAARGVRSWLVTTDEEDVRAGIFTPGLGFIEAARGVRTIAISRAGLLVLHDYADDKGTLSLLTSRGTMTAIARGVPAKGLFDSGQLELEQENVAVGSLRQVDIVLHDTDGDMGTLSRIEDDGRLAELARDVPAWSPSSYTTVLRGGQLLDPTRNIVVLSYLSDFDPAAAAGTLSVVDPDARNIVIDEQVTSHVSSGDTNRRGVLYATAGAVPRVWFVQQ